MRRHTPQPDSGATLHLDLRSWGETPVTTQPGDDTAAGKAGRGHLRASHADREQVIGTLKAAFVAGMLAKDELDLRVGQALASRTCPELATLTADLPAGLAAVQPPQPARAQGEQKVLRPGRWMAVSTAAYAGAWACALFLSPHGGDSQTGGVLIFGGGLVYLCMLIASVGAIIINWQDRRSGRQPPRRPVPGAAGHPSRRPPSAGAGGELPPPGHGHQHTAEAAPIRPPGPRFSRWRPPVSLPSAR
jgi:Domain of unknown function (DUF1707)